MQAKSHFVQPASKNNPAKGKQNKHNSTHLPFINITEEIGGRWNGGKLEPMSVKQKGNIKPMPMIYKMDIAKRKKKEGGGEPAMPQCICQPQNRTYGTFAALPPLIGTIIWKAPYLKHKAVTDTPHPLAMMFV